MEPGTATAGWNFGARAWRWGRELVERGRKIAALIRTVDALREDVTALKKQVAELRRHERPGAPRDVVSAGGIFWGRFGSEAKRQPLCPRCGGQSLWVPLRRCDLSNGTSDFVCAGAPHGGRWMLTRPEVEEGEGWQLETRAGEAKSGGERTTASAFDPSGG